MTLDKPHFAIAGLPPVLNVVFVMDKQSNYEAFKLTLRAHPSEVMMICLSDMSQC